MKKKISIKISDEKLIKVRKELRILLRLLVEERISELHELYMSSGGKSFLNEIKVQQIALTRAYLRSPIGCRLCGTKGINLDLTYDPVLEAWYCEDCYRFNQRGLGHFYP